MEKIADDGILEFRPNTLQEVRRNVNLDTPGRIQEAIAILDVWIQKQTHFKRKDFNKEYLERTLVTAGGSVEKSKRILDKLCTMKTIMPDFFNVTNEKKEFERLGNLLNLAALPKLTPENYRVILYKVLGNFDTKDVFSFYRRLIMLAEYSKFTEYNSGYICVADFRDISLMNIISKANPLEFGQLMKMLNEGYGLKLKGLYLLSTSPVIETVINMFKQVLSPKLRDRLIAASSEKDLYKILPKDILPVEYGGQERSLKKLSDEWIEVLSSKENMSRYSEMSEFKIDESYRRTDNFNDAYMGMPGAFRTLNVD